MTEFIIDDGDLRTLENKVVVLTGGSSGIGLATVLKLLELGAKVVNGDLKPPNQDDPKLTFVKVDVREWDQLHGVFKKAMELYGRIDHVFVNAGVGQTTDYQDDKFSESGELLEPDHRTIDINLKAAVNTTYLAIYYMKQQKHEANSTSSIVITASATGFQRFRVPDYAIAKHGAIGIMRGLEPTLYPALPIRINVLAPEFVDTGIINARLVEEAGSSADPPVVVAKAAVLLMADEKRHGQMIYTVGGKYQELEGRMNELVRELRGNRISLDHVMKYLLENTPK